MDDENVDDFDDNIDNGLTHFFPNVSDFPCVVQLLRVYMLFKQMVEKLINVLFRLH